MKYKIGQEVIISKSTPNSAEKGKILWATELNGAVFYAYSYITVNCNEAMGSISEVWLNAFNKSPLEQYVGEVACFNGGKRGRLGYFPALVDVFVKVIDYDDEHLLVEFPDLYQGLAMTVDGNVTEGLHSGAGHTEKDVCWWCFREDLEFEND